MAKSTGISAQLKVEELLDAASDAQTIVQAERLCEDLTRILATAQNGDPHE